VLIAIKNHNLSQFMSDMVDDLLTIHISVELSGLVYCRYPPLITNRYVKNIFTGVTYIPTSLRINVIWHCLYYYASLAMNKK